MTQQAQAEALQIADYLEGQFATDWLSEASTELRRLYARVQELQEISSAERQKRQENELMAECMDMVRHDLITAGVIDKSVPPMMLSNAVIAAVQRPCSQPAPTPPEQELKPIAPIRPEEMTSVAAWIAFQAGWAHAERAHGIGVEKK